MTFSLIHACLALLVISIGIYLIAGIVLALNRKVTTKRHLIIVGIVAVIAIMGGFWIKKMSDDYYAGVTSYQFHENDYDLEAMYADLQSEGATILRFEVPVEQGSEIAMLDDHGTVTYAYYDACITPSPTPTLDKDKYEVDFEKYRKDN